MPADPGEAHASPQPRRLAWQEAPVVAVEAVTPRVRSLRLRVGWAHPFRAGQHVDIRLTAPDGYQAQRSYSIASAPGEPSVIEILVERLEDGEVSGFLHEVAAVGDTIELRGPIGGHFIWEPGDGPMLLLGGGSGVVPLLSMLRHRALVAPEIPALLLYSARTAEELIAREELLARAEREPGFRLLLALTREPGVRLAGARTRRIDAAMVAEALSLLPGPPARTYVCGSNAFVGAAADLLVEAGLRPASIATERYGE